MKKFFILLTISLFLFGCDSKNNQVVSHDYDWAKQIMKEREYIIIDVRTKEEYEEGHLVGAIHIPYDQISSNITIDYNKVIFVYCKSGGRSKIAFDIFTQLGYSVYDLGAFSDIDLPKE